MTPEPKDPPPGDPPADPKLGPDGKTLLSDDPKDPKEEPKTGAPEKYEDFKLPEGIKLEGEQLESAVTLFKEMGLDQAGAQKLVDYHTAQMKALAEGPANAYKEMREGWQTAAKADPEIGPKVAQIKETLGRAYDVIGDPKLVGEFKAAMDLTGVGDHPAFIKLFNKLASLVIEPRHVSGQPNKDAPKAPGEAPKSVANALYPNLS